MLQKLSLVIPCDSTGVFLTRLFHIYQHNVANIGSFIKVSVRITKPKCKLKKKKKLRSFLIRSCNTNILPDTSHWLTSTNNSVLLKKRLSMRGKVVFGPTTYIIKRRKFLKSFAKIL